MFNLLLYIYAYFSPIPSNNINKRLFVRVSSFILINFQLYTNN